MTKPKAFHDTITAIATPAGRGGIGIVRISGPAARAIGEAITGVQLEPRRARYAPFLDAPGERIDHGVALLFSRPHSYTGEDTVELQGHGGPVVLDAVLRRTCELGARLARPGEFTERAFLNGRMDLAQAEAVADLIAATSEQAARSALRSLDGEFSRLVDGLLQALVELRTYVEAALDFPEEEIDFLSDDRTSDALRAMRKRLEQVLDRADQGALLTDGATVVIAGAPNAGKSSLMNALLATERAIVTEVAGTTRDVLREAIHLDGVPVHLVDTAGLRESDDPIEQEGVRRAEREIERADLVLLVVDATNEAEAVDSPGTAAKTLIVHNKIDLLPRADHLPSDRIPISATRGDGLDALRAELLGALGRRPAGEGDFSARRRHVAALRQTREHLRRGAERLQEGATAELLAEDLRAAQETLGEITGRVTSDDLLGRIFSSFCIGK